LTEPDSKPAGPSNLSRSNTSCSECGYGSGRSNTAFTTLKIAVCAPIPRASTRTATNVNPGDLRSWRRANVTSFMLFGVKRGHWIGFGCAHGWQITCGQCDSGQQDCDQHKGRCVESAHVIEQRMQRARAH